MGQLPGIPAAEAAYEEDEVGQMEDKTEEQETEDEAEDADTFCATTAQGGKVGVT